MTFFKHWVLLKGSWSVFNDTKCDLHFIINMWLQYQVEFFVFSAKGKISRGEKRGKKRKKKPSHNAANVAMAEWLSSMQVSVCNHPTHQKQVNWASSKVRSHCMEVTHWAYQGPSCFVQGSLGISSFHEATWTSLFCLLWVKLRSFE